MSDEKSAVKGDENEAVQATLAMLVELDHVAAPGRKFMFDALKKLLAERDVNLTPSIYRTYCTGGCPRAFVPKMLAALDKKRISADKFAAELTAAVQAAFDSSPVESPKALIKMMGKARERGMALGALTSLSEERAAKIISRLGMDKLGLQVVSVPAVLEFPTADGWLRLSKKVGVTRARCTALVSSGPAARSALSGGLRCIVVPDEFTAHQDFGGADAVAPELTDSQVAGIFSIAGVSLK